MRTRKKEQHLFRKKISLPSISSTLFVCVFCTKGLFLVTFWLCQKIRTKKHAKNVDDIDTWGRFHQHSTYSFCARRDPESARTQSSHQYLFTLLGSTSVKAVRRTLMKSSPGRINEIHKTSLTFLSLSSTFLNKFRWLNLDYNFHLKCYLHEEK
jgi:hypothetical protein